MSEYPQFRRKIELEDAAVSNSALQSGILEEIMKELKNVRLEIKELLQENHQLRDKIDEIRKEQTVQKQILRSLPVTPIRDAILGEWKMVEHENWKGAYEVKGVSFEEFSENVKYKLKKGKLKQSGGDYLTYSEDEDEFSVVYNHLITCLDDDWKIDRFFQDGKLHVTETSEGEAWTRIYVKI